MNDDRERRLVEAFERNATTQTTLVLAVEKCYRQMLWGRRVIVLCCVLWLVSSAYALLVLARHDDYAHEAVESIVRACEAR